MAGDARELTKGESGARRRLPFGAGTAVALVVILGLVVWDRLPHGERPQPIPASTVIATPSGSGPLPDVRYILSKKSELGLTDEQAARIGKLADESERKMDDINRKLSGKSGALDRLGETAKSRDTTVTQKDLEKGADDMAGLLKEASNVRSSYWKQATALLSDSQRSRLEKMREADWQKRVRSLGQESGK